MRKFNVPTRSDVDRKSRKIFDKLKERIGYIPNVYAFIGHSPHALKGLRELENQMSKGSFEGRERIAIHLAVSQVNDCEYCIASHSFIARKSGFSEEECIQIRKGEHDEPKIEAIIKLAQDIQRTNGHPDEEYLVHFFDHGYDVAALVDMIALVSINTMTNYVYSTTGFAIDFPEVPEIPED